MKNAATIKACTAAMARVMATLTLKAAEVRLRGPDGHERAHGHADGDDNVLPHMPFDILKILFRRFVHS